MQHEGAEEGGRTSWSEGTGSSMSLISDAARWNGAGACDSCCSLWTAALTALALAPAPWTECIKQHLRHIIEPGSARLCVRSTRLDSIQL